MTVLAALLGVGVHVLLALPGPGADNADGRRHLPLRVALRTGAPRLLLVLARAVSWRRLWSSGTRGWSGQRPSAADLSRR